jgi:isopentenyl-diphosphate Delta-isomerase
VRRPKPLSLPAARATDSMPKPGDRKAEHLLLALDPAMQPRKNPFDDYSFEHQALPDLSYDAIDPSCSFLGRQLSAPLLISCMTGGTREAARINRNLALAAEAMGIAVGVGSQRRAIEDPSAVSSFQIRAHAPSVPLLANLGAVQLNYGYGIDQCRRAVEMIDADALVLHLNPLQEAIQPEGQRNFSGLLEKIGEIAGKLEVPLIVKEVGCGISRSVAERLLSVGVGMVDTAGAGGTRWSRIEAKRAKDATLGERFADWGIPTPAAIRNLRDLPGLFIIGSGGVRHGIDAAKAMASGAHLVGMAYRFLRAAHESTEAVADRVRQVVEELRLSMFCVGAGTLEQLRRTPLYTAGGPLG